MAIAYQSDFQPVDYVDNVDRVQAGGPNGINFRFNSIQAEFGKLEAIVAEVDTEINRRPRVERLVVLAKQIVAGGVSDPEVIDKYDNADFPDEMRKLYHVVIEPSGTSDGRATSHFIHEPDGPDRTSVSVWFKNEHTEMIRFTARIFAMG